MVNAIHALIYSDDAPASRAFFRDVLEWPFVEHELDSGWLIFRSGPSEIGIHPTQREWEGETYTHRRHHSIALMCDDLAATVSKLSRKGAQFVGEIENQGFGLTIFVLVPGAGEIMLYQPLHPKAYDLPEP